MQKMHNIYFTVRCLHFQILARGGGGLLLHILVQPTVVWSKAEMSID